MSDANTIEIRITGNTQSLRAALDEAATGVAEAGKEIGHGGDLPLASDARQRP